MHNLCSNSLSQLCKKSIWQELVNSNLQADTEAEMLKVWMYFVNKETMAYLLLFHLKKHGIFCSQLDSQLQKAEGTLTFPLEDIITSLQYQQRVETCALSYFDLYTSSQGNPKQGQFPHPACTLCRCKKKVFFPQNLICGFCVWMKYVYFYGGDFARKQVQKYFLKG